MQIFGVNKIKKNIYITTFIQKEYIKLIKSDIKDMYYVTKDSYFQ